MEGAVCIFTFEYGRSVKNGEVGLELCAPVSTNEHTASEGNFRVKFPMMEIHSSFNRRNEK